MNPLLTFIQNQLKAGVSREVITSQLMGQGWTKVDVDQAFALISISPAPAYSAPAPIPPTPATITPMPSQPTPTFVQQNISQPKKHSRTGLIISIIIVLLLLIGGGAYAYFTFINPATSPKDILKKSVEAYSNGNVKSFSFSATTTGQAKNQLGNGIPSQSDFTLTSNGSVDFHVPEAPLFDVNFAIKGSTGVSTGSLSLGLELMYVSKSIYLTLKNFQYTSTDTAQAQSAAMVNGVSSMLGNKWIQFDVTNSVNTGSQEGLSSQSQADNKIIQDYVSGMSYITAINTVGTETLDNVSTYHIKMTVQGDQKLIDIITKLNSENTSKALTSGQLDDISKNILNQKVDLDVWIGKDDLLVYKIVSSPVTINSAQAKTEGTVTQEISFSDYNKPMSIVAPEGAISFETLMKNMFGGTPVSPALLMP